MKAQSKNKKHTIEEKLQAVELYKQGLGADRISKRLSICESVVVRCLLIYKVLNNGN